MNNHSVSYLQDAQPESIRKTLAFSKAEEVSNDEEVTQVKVLMDLADDELTVGKNHTRNGEWIDITMRKLNHALQEQLKEEKKINEKWLTNSKKVSQCISEQIPYQKKKVLVLKFKDSVERLNPDSKLPNFNTKRILVPKSQVINESLKPTKTSINPESFKDSKAESLIPLPSLKNLQGASPSSEVNSTQKTQESNSQIQQTELSKSVDSSKMSQDSKPKFQNSSSSKSLRPKPIQKPQLKCELCHYTNHSTDDCYRILYCMKCKKEYHRTSNHEMYTASLKRSDNYKAQPYQYASPSKQILEAKAKPFPLCTHYCFNDHRPDDCRN
ncbi:hypothetical protein Tco_0051695 [Tanacetum coccineum]